MKFNDFENFIKSSQTKCKRIQYKKEIFCCIALTKLGVDKYKNERLALIYMFETLNPNKERYIDSDHLSHYLWTFNVRHRYEVHILLLSYGKIVKKLKN